VVVDTLGTDVIFFGMGSGSIGTWGVPDNFFEVASVFLSPEGGDPLAVPPTEGIVASLAQDGINGGWYGPAPACPAGDWCKAAAPSLLKSNAGTHRLRMTFDATTKEWVGSMDIDYAGGAFVADVTTATYDLTPNFDDGVFAFLGWPTLPSKIYFGGDDGATFKDFVVTVAGAGIPGDFDGDSDVDGADFLKWQRDDATPAGLANWQANYGAPLLAAAGAVPEPAAGLLLLMGALGFCGTRRGR